jgi:hypothetical protein
MRFQKGQSGNPSGRPKGWAEIQVLARSMAPEAIEEIRKIAKGDKTSAVRLAAWKEILDRGLGKATQDVKVYGDADNPIVIRPYTEVLDELSDEQFDALETVALKLLAGPPTEGGAGGGPDAGGLAQSPPAPKGKARAGKGGRKP